MRFSKSLAILALFLSICLSHAQTTVLFDLGDGKFNQNPVSNRVVRIRNLSPFPGNWIWQTSNVSGQFYFSNALATTYSGTILAPPASTDFAFTVTATNLGVISASTITSIPSGGVPTFPAGATAWSIAASDARYAFSTNVSGQSPLSAIQTTNAIAGAIPTNFWSASATFWISNVVSQGHLNTNQYAAGTLLTSTTNAAGLVTFNAAAQTNGFSSIVFSNALTFTTTNQLTVTSNALQTQIGNAGISANTATNIAAFQIGQSNVATLALIATKANTNAPTIWNPSFVGLSDFRHGSVTNIQKLSSDNLGTGGASGNESIAFGFDAEARGNYSIAVGDDAITGADSASAFGNSVEASGFASHAVGESIQVQGQDAIGMGANISASSANSFVWNGTGDTIGDNGISSFTAQATNGFYFVGSPMHGNALGLTNLPLVGISTNGSKALQIPVSIGGITVWTNVATALGSTLGTSNIATVVFTNQLPALTNSFVTQPNLQASFASGTNTYAGFLNAATNIGIFTVGASQFFETLQGGNFTFQLTPKSPGATFKVNGAILGGSTITGNAFFGDGWGLTNTTSTNLALGALTQVTNIASSLSSSGITASTATNIAAFKIGISNAVLFATKMDGSNGFSTGQTATNFTTQGNVGFGRDGLATNIISSTNFVCFLTAGSAQATNGAFVWSASLGVYTNWLNGAILTNNTSAWLLQTNGVTLYSLSGASPIGLYSAISGALPAPLGVYTAAINDHMVLLGYFSVTNLQQQFTSVSNSAIANLNGFGTNTFLTNPVVAWSPQAALNIAPNGGTLNFQALSAGMANTISGAGLGAAILSGATNLLSTDGGGVIVGGIRNNLSGGSGNCDVIVGGKYNVLVGSAGIGSVDANFLGGGYSNTIGNVSQFSFLGGGFVNKSVGGYTVSLGGLANTNSADGSVILGGNSNSVSGVWSLAAGRNVINSNDNSFVYSDGAAFNTTTNSQFLVHATNGVGINTNRSGGSALNVLGNVNATSFTSGGTPLIAQASAIPFTNASAAGITSTNLGDAANTNLAMADINGNLFDGFFGSGLSYNAATRTLSASGSGSQTPVLATVNYAGFGFTNAAASQFTNSVSVGGQMGVSALIVTNGVTNLSTLKVVGNQTNAGTFSVTGNQTNFSGTYLEALTANTLVMLDANKKLTSIANAAGVFTNDASGNFGYAALIDGSALGASAHVKTGPTTNLISSEDATGYTNTVSYLHEGVTTNITVAFNGTIQSFTVTNGPDVFLGYAGANGSCSYRFTTNVTLHFSYQPTWLAGSNNTITNGILNFSSWGGTNAAQIGAARLEKQ